MTNDNHHNNTKKHPNNDTNSNIEIFGEKLEIVVEPNPAQEDSELGGSNDLILGGGGACCGCATSTGSSCSSATSK